MCVWGGEGEEKGRVHPSNGLRWSSHAECTPAKTDGSYYAWLEISAALMG